MVAQIDKEQLAVVALAVDPPRQPGLPTGISKPQRSASVGPIRVVHRGRFRAASRSGNTARKSSACQGGPPLAISLCLPLPESREKIRCGAEDRPFDRP